MVVPWTDNLKLCRARCSSTVTMGTRACTARRFSHEPRHRCGWRGGRGVRAVASITAMARAPTVHAGWNQERRRARAGPCRAYPAGLEHADLQAAGVWRIRANMVARHRCHAAGATARAYYAPKLEAALARQKCPRTPRRCPLVRSGHSATAREGRAIGNRALARPRAKWRFCAVSKGLGCPAHPDSPLCQPPCPPVR